MRFMIYGELKEKSETPNSKNLKWTKDMTIHEIFVSSYEELAEKNRNVSRTTRYFKV